MPRTDTLHGNGHRRRELRARVLAEETRCALCGDRVDKTLTYTEGAHGRRCPGPPCTGCVPHPRRPEVDEDIPRIRGGSPYDRRNCHLMHRECNRWKSTMTLTEAKAAWGKARAPHRTHSSQQPQGPQRPAGPPAAAIAASPIW